MDDAQPVTRKAPYRRKMTDKRRDQNRAAQKLYRQKRKERLALLEQQVTTLQDQPQHHNQSESLQQPHENYTPLKTIPPNSTHQQTEHASISSTSSNHRSFTALKHLLLSNDSRDGDELLSFALKEQPDLSTVLLAGLQALRTESDESWTPQELGQTIKWRPDLWPAESFDGSSSIPLFPDPGAGGFFLRPQPSLDVFFHNSQRIGLKLEEMIKPTSQSPWYTPDQLALVSMESIPPDLIPTPAQCRIPHHPFIDTIPFPWLRERAITLAALDPPAYDKFELKADILSGGMVCWKSRARSEGLPWDRRNWEVQPWFWRKWGWLVEEQGKVEQQSRWWRAMRGQQ